MPMPTPHEERYDRATVPFPAPPCPDVSRFMAKAAYAVLVRLPGGQGPGLTASACDGRLEVLITVRAVGQEQGDSEDAPAATVPLEALIPNQFQQRVLDALEDRALRTDDLAAAVDCDRRKLFKPHGLAELRTHGLIDWRKEVGFFRPDRPPPRPRRHSPDFRCVAWGAKTYSFTAGQAAVVRQLWTAWENETPEVGQETLLEASGIEAGKVADLFRDHPAWGTLIAAGASRGTFRLADPAADRAAEVSNGATR